MNSVVPALDKKGGEIMAKEVGEGVKFERIRRVTGYLSGDVSRFNNGKRAEEKDRVKHSGIEKVIKDNKEMKCDCK